MQKIRMKKQWIAIAICAVLISIGLLFVNPATAFADSTQPSFESFTDTDHFYYGGVEYKIADYAASMRREGAVNYILDDNYAQNGDYACTIKYALDPDTNIMRLIANGDDPVTQIVPKHLFQTANNGIVHVGKEYGFFIKTSQLSDGLLLSNVFVFDFTNKFDKQELKDTIQCDITSLFQREYVYIPNAVNVIPTRNIQPGKNTYISPDLNNIIPAKIEQTNIVVPLPYFSSVNLYLLAESNRYYMTDIVNTISLFNEQHPNKGDPEYNVFSDKGKFILRHDIQYGAKVYDPDADVTSEAREVILKALFQETMGVLSKITTNSDKTYTVLSTIAEALTSIKGQPISINQINTFKPQNITTQGYIEDTGELPKSDTSKIELKKGEYGQNAVLYFGEGDKLASEYILNYTPVLNESGNGFKTPWETRIKRGYTFQFKSTTDGSDVVSVGDVHDFRQRNENDREYLTLQGTQIVRLFPNGENLFTFTPERTGNYTLNSVGADSAVNLQQINATNGEAVTANLTGFDRALSMELTAGVPYYFKTNYIDDAKFGQYTLDFEFTPQSVLLGNNNVNLKYDETYIRFSSPANVNYRFTLRNTTDALRLLNSNFEVVQTSVNGELFTVLNRDETYYLRIDNSASAPKDVVLTVKDEMYVFFENINGVTNPIPGKITFSVSDPVNLPIPQQPGKTFDGWWTDLGEYGEQVTNANFNGHIQPELHLSAKWTPIHYTIFYEENGGTAIPDGDYTVDHAVTLNRNITKTGYVFCGWYDNASLNGAEVKTIPAGSLGNKTFYAKWVKEKFTIRFDLNSAQTDGFAAGFAASDNVVGNQKEVFYNKSYTLPTPSLTGFEFDGWFYQGNLVSAENPYDFETDIELVAKWLREKFYIKVGFQTEAGAIAYQWLDTNGSVLSFNSDKGAQFDYNLLSPNNYVTQLKLDGKTNQNNAFLASLYKVGHQFVSFVFDASTAVPKVFDWSTLTKEEIGSGNVIILEAYYVPEKEFKIYVEEVAGVTGTQGNLPLKWFDEVIDYKTAPTKIGHTFSGYVVSGNAHNSVFTGELAIGQPFHYAKMPDLSQNREMDGEIIYVIPVFTPNKYSVTFDVAGLAPKSVTYGEAYRDFPVPTKTGYDFKGWYTGTNGTGTQKTDPTGYLNYWDIASNYLLYAKWSAKQYKVTLDKQGGTGGSDFVIASYELPMPTNLTAPSKSGHIFQGYYELPNGKGIQYYKLNLTSTTNWIKAENTIIYAKWTPITYTIKYYPNGGNGNTEESTHTYNISKNLRTNTFTKTNYNFAGWAYSSYGGIVYSNSQSVINLTEDNLAVISLYAQWTPKTYNLYITSYHISDAQSMSTSNYGATEIPQNHTYTFEESRTFSFTSHQPTPPYSPVPTVLSGVFSGLYVRYDSSSGSAVSRDYYNKNGSTVELKANCFSENAVVFIVVEYKNNCVAEGTLITLSDGTQKAVEDLTGNEQLLVWNLFTGAFDSAPILFIDHDPARQYEVINLGFSDGTSVKVISEHGFWDFDLNEYVFLRSDAAKYLGHWFNKQTTAADGTMGWTKVKLVSVNVQTETTTAWSPVTYGHLCYYVNGMLSMPGATEGLINIFDVDPDTMKIDGAAYAADVAEYGLYTYEEFAATYPVPEVIFEAFGGKYLKISIGKGLLTQEMLESLIARYAKFFDPEF